MRIDIAIQQLNPNDFDNYYMHKNNCNKFYAFYNRNGDKISKNFPENEFKNFMCNFKVSKYIKMYNGKIENEILENEIQMIKLMRSKQIFINLEGYHVKMYKLCGRIRENINKKIQFLGETNNADNNNSNSGDSDNSNYRT